MYTTSHSWLELWANLCALLIRFQWFNTGIYICMLWVGVQYFETELQYCSYNLQLLLHLSEPINLFTCWCYKSLIWSFAADCCNYILVNLGNLYNAWESVFIRTKASSEFWIRLVPNIDNDRLLSIIYRYMLASEHKIPVQKKKTNGHSRSRTVIWCLVQVYSNSILQVQTEQCKCVD